MAAYRKTRGVDPSAALPEALADLEKARELNPGNVGVWLELGMVNSMWGQHLAGLGEDPAGKFHDADECLAKAETLSPSLASIPEQRAALEWSWAEFELRSGRDPGAHLDLAEAQATRSRDLVPNFYTIYETLGVVRTLRGRDAERRGANPSERYRKAVEEFSTALGQNARATGCLMGRADARRRWASYLARTGGDAGALFGEALEDADHALSIDSAWDEVWHARGLVRRDRGAANGDEADLRAAEADFSKAISLNPGAVDSCMARGEVRLLLAERFGADLRAQARTDVNMALQLAPRRADIVALRERLK